MYLKPRLENEAVRELLFQATSKGVDDVTTECIMKVIKDRVTDSVLIDELTDLLNVWKNMPIEKFC